MSEIAGGGRAGRYLRISAVSKIASAGVNGQFRTPRHIIRMMVELMDPKADDVICDPACGTSGFLVAAGEYLKEHRKEEIFFNRQKKDHYMNHMFFGYDMDRTMLRIGAMNMMTHGIDNPFIEYRDSLSDQNPDKEEVFPDSGQSAVQGQSGRGHRVRRSAESLQDQENRAAVPGAVPADAEASAGAAPASSRTACCSARPPRTRPSARSWWTATGWRP